MDAPERLGQLMVQRFTGTSTGNVYRAGQNYSMGGNVYRANSDGSFTNLRSGHTAVGSSQAIAAQQAWNDDGFFWGKGVGSHGDSWFGSSDTGAGGAGPGEARVTTGSPAASGGGASSHGTFTVTGNPAQAEVTQLIMGGQNMPVDPGMSDMQDVENRYGDSEIISTAAGLSILTMDALRGLTVNTGRVSRDFVNAPSWFAGGVNSFAGWLDDNHPSRASGAQQTSYMPWQMPFLSAPREGADGVVRTGGGF